MTERSSLFRHASDHLKSSDWIQISAHDGKYDELEGLDPLVMWKSSTQAGLFDLSYGASASIYPTRNLASLPRNLWAKVGTTLAGWGLSVRAEMSGLKYRKTYMDFDIDNKVVDLNVHLVTSTGNDNGVRSVQASKGLNIVGGHLTVTPRLNFESDTKDLLLSFDTDNTNVNVTASAHKQEVTLSRQLNDNNRVAPTFSSAGDVSLAWERRINDDSSVTTTLKPNDNLNVQWKDNDWTAYITMPIAGTYINGVDVGVTREINF